MGAQRTWHRARPYLLTRIVVSTLRVCCTSSRRPTWRTALQHSADPRNSDLEMSLMHVVWGGVGWQLLITPSDGEPPMPDEVLDMAKYLQMNLKYVTTLAARL